MASAPAMNGPTRRAVTLRAHDRDEVVDIAASVDARYPGRHDLSAATVTDCDDALVLLDAVWRIVIDHLASAPTHSVDGHAGDIELLSRVKSAIGRIQAGQIERVDTALASLRDAMADLDEIDDADHLLDRAAIAATTLGFDRAMISTVCDGRWVPTAGHIERDPAWASEIVAAGRADPEIIDATLPEAEMIRRLRPILVDDVGKLARRYTTVIDASKGQRYVAAPILANRTVIGFVHADAFYRTRRFTNSDVRLLGLFGEFLGSALSRLMMLGELHALRAEVEGISSRITDIERTWSGHTRRSAHGRAPLTAVPSLPSRIPRGSGPAAAAVDKLTRREREVLELVAEGATNGRIARALTISEGTVKGHVKHIFRKLGTTNRAEAVAYWLRLSS